MNFCVVIQTISEVKLAYIHVLNAREVCPPLAQEFSISCLRLEFARDLELLQELIEVFVIS